MLGKEEAAASKKQKQAVLDEILTPSPIKSAESSMKDSQKSGPKEMDAKIASYFYENGIAFNTLKSFPHPLVRETGQLMDTSRQRPSDPQQAKP